MSEVPYVEAYFELVLKKDVTIECWTPEEQKEYVALKSVYEKHRNGRTYEQFLEQVIRGK